MPTAIASELLLSCEGDAAEAASIARRHMNSSIKDKWYWSGNQAAVLFLLSQRHSCHTSHP